MMKIVLSLAVGSMALMAAPIVTPAKAEGIKMAQDVGVEVGRDRDRDRDHRFGRDTTVGIGAGGVSVGPRCHTVTTRVDRPDGRSIIRRERRCD